MNRRDFIKTVAVASLAREVGVLASPAEADAARQINTVLGPIPATGLGQTLMHEHILTDFIGADRVGPGRYDAQDVIRAALPHLREVKSLGCGTLVECTPAYMGRAPEVMAALSKASGLHILTNTGFYGAAADRYVPRSAFAQTAEALATLWTREFQDGIPPTGIRPGFIKIGTDAGPLSDIDAKLASAAALTHQRTGLAIVSHSGTELPRWLNSPCSSNMARSRRRSSGRMPKMSRTRRIIGAPPTKAPGWNSTASHQKVRHGTST